MQFRLVSLSTLQLLGAILLFRLVNAQQAPCPAADDNGNALTKAGNALDDEGFYSCQYGAEEFCTYFSNGDFSSGSSVCPDRGGVFNGNGGAASSSTSTTIAQQTSTTSAIIVTTTSSSSSSVVLTTSTSLLSTTRSLSTSAPPLTTSATTSSGFLTSNTNVLGTNTVNTNTNTLGGVGTGGLGTNTASSPLTTTTSGAVFSISAAIHPAAVGLVYVVFRLLW